MPWNRVSRTLLRPGLCSLVAFLTFVVLLQPVARAEDAWDAVFLAGSKVGYIHTFIEKVSEKGRDLYRVRVDTVLTFRRGQDSVVIKMMYGTIEAPDGEVLRLDTRTLTSDRELRVYGDAVRGQMKLILEGSGQRQEQTIPWSNEVRGPYAAEQSMARKPMEEGEIRKLKMYIPDLNKVCDIALNAGPMLELPLGDGSRRPLRKVAQSTTLDGKPRPEFDTTLFVDSSGQVLKQETDLLGGMVLYRTTREGATSPTGRAKFDQIKNSVAKVANVLPNPERTRSVKYRLTLRDENPAQAFPADRRQSITPESGTSVIMTVQTAGPEDGEAGPPEVDPRYLSANGLITSEDDRVRRLAREAVGTATDPWERSTRIMHWVFENLRDKNFETTFAAASEVARNLSGDCTEHSVLTAAMCRASGIPARVVVGLIYVERLGGFGYHMWNEVYVNRRWVAIDASFDQSSVDAVHIKLIDTSLEGVSPFEAFLPIVRVLGKLQVDPLELR